MNEKTRGAQMGNTNAQKGEEKLESFLHLRVSRKDKSRWVHHAQNRGGLSEWVIKTLNEASQTSDNNAE